ncbi:MAG: hypothetical protein KAJ60_04780 [Desulfobulbaceae bacterium]|nr:hypothetical protein [Desulfobulbaceae bacterium]
MLEIIKKTMLTGLGLAFMSKGKIESLAKDLADFGKLSEKEGKEFVDEILQKSEAARKDLEKQIEKVMKSSLQKMNLVTKNDLEELKEQVAQLKKELTEKGAKD